MPAFMQYPITQGFGPTAEPLDSGGFNKGYDFATPIGTPIEALVGGTVISAGDSGDGWGISVKVRDAQGNTHNYGHLSAVNVQPGQTVNANTLLGASGNSGKSTGPHLSYDVWDANGGYFDPFGGGMPEFDLWPGDWPFNNDDGEDGERNPLDEFTWTPEERVQFLSDAGLTWVSGNGPDAIWRMPDGDTISEINAFTKMLSGSGAINVPSGSSATQPLTRSVGGTLYQYNPTTQQWTPVAGGGSTSSGFTLGSGQTRYGPNGEIIAQAPGGASSGFTLSPGQARFDATGRPIAAYPAESDPYAAIKLGQAQMDLQIKQQNLQFLREKHSFEMSQGMAREARETQGQIFNQQFSIQKLQTDIDQFNARMAFDQQQANIQNEERRQSRLSDLATQIGTLAQDPGDRARYASTVLANSGMPFGQDRATGSMITNDSLMPLESLLRQRSDLMGQQPQVNVPPVSGINLGALQAPTANPAAMQLAPPQVSGMPDTTPGYDTGTGQPGIPYGGIALDPEEINAGAQWAPTPGFEQPAGTAGGINLAAILGRDGDLPMKSKGGMEDEAFIAGESGPEIVIPHGDGKAVILNAEQAKVAGIDLSKLQKFADGGLFDGLIKDNDRGMATSFLNEATNRALSGTPWAGGSIPGPTFASSPGFDPIVAQLMASINAMQTGVPAASYLRNAALRRPAGVNEAPIRRSA